jgi:hypothetical protein
VRAFVLLAAFVDDISLSNHRTRCRPLDTGVCSGLPVERLRIRASCEELLKERARFVTSCSLVDEPVPPLSADRAINRRDKTDKKGLIRQDRRCSEELTCTRSISVSVPKPAGKYQ